jgi:hypothetical protein
LESFLLGFGFWRFSEFEGIRSESHFALHQRRAGMTEPDEALLYAQQLNLSMWTTHSVAEAYRAGQSASAAEIAARDAEIARLRGLVEKLAWSERWGIKDNLMANGCSHGFKPAASCQNSGCWERDLDREINAALNEGGPA